MIVIATAIVISGSDIDRGVGSDIAIASTSHRHSYCYSDSKRQ